MTQRNSTANLFSDRTPVYRYEFNDPTSATVTGVGFAAADPAGDTAPSPSPTAAAQHRVEPVQQFGERSLVRSPYGNHVSTTIAQEHNCAFWAQTPMINPPAGPPGEARQGTQFDLPGGLDFYVPPGPESPVVNNPSGVLPSSAGGSSNP